jgi:hypothetical protein
MEDAETENCLSKAKLTSKKSEQAQGHSMHEEQTISLHFYP